MLSDTLRIDLSELRFQLELRQKQEHEAIQISMLKLLEGLTYDEAYQLLHEVRTLMYRQQSESWEGSRAR